MAAHFELVGHTLGHYRIVEQIGAGGMGVVYRAHDLQLERDVALKVLPAGTLGDDSARKQFRKEALALAKLNHPNIATVFEFSSQEGIDFLAMELIPGQPLNAWLKGERLPEPEIVRLGTQLADGLAAAHDQGVIHRDLKPGNLFISADGRLKILDFGLAKLAPLEGGGDLTRSVTSEDAGVSGTVPYMSPEQLRGLPVDPRSDLYAAGAVLYEMAAAQRPFPQTQSAELMGAILHKSPPPLRSLNPDASPALEHVVSKSLEKDASQRYQSARELRVALESLSLATGGSAAQVLAVPASPAIRAILAGGLAALLLAGLAIGLNFRGVRNRIFRRPAVNTAEQPTASLAPVKARRSVAVLGLKNLSGQADKAWLATALAEMLTTELGAGDELRTVPGENVARMKASLALPDEESYGRETLARIRQNLNADEVVVGSYVALGGNQIRLDLRLQDAVAGEILASVSAKGREDQMDEVVNRAGADLRAKLGVGEVSPADAAAVKAALPAGAEAARLYSQGLAKLHARDTLAARDLLERSIALEPKFALAHSALAAAWTSLGYDGKAATEAKIAFDLSGGLRREDKLEIEARYREATRDWESAIRIYRALSEFYPDNLEYGLRLASAQHSGGKQKDALSTLQQLRRLPPPASQDPRIDLEEAGAYFVLSQWKDVSESAARAAAKARTSGERLVLAQALAQQGSALRYLSEFDKAEAAFKESERLFSAAGDRWGAANATQGLGVNAYNRGDLKGARALYEQSLAVFREIGSQHSAATCLNAIAVTLYDQGNLDAAQKIYEEALRIHREVGDRRGIANNLNSIANVLADRGDQAGAQAKYEEALKLFREQGGQFEVAMILSNLGELSLDMGNLTQAKKQFEQALEVKRGLHNRHSEAYTLSALGDLYLEQGELAAARKSHEDALAIRTELGEKANAAQDSLSLARLTLEEGKPVEALAGARQAGAEFQAQKQIGYQVSAHVLAARCLLDTGKIEDARSEIHLAQQLLGKSDDRTSSLSVAITAARIAGAAGQFADARSKLEAALAGATKSHMLFLQYEARLALGELEMKSGKAAIGRTHLTALQEEAGARGFGLIARKAKTAAAG